MNSKQIKVKELLSILKKKYKIKLSIVGGKDGLKNRLETLVINRPGITLAGYFKNFVFNRIQMFGRGEYDYVNSLKVDKRRKLLNKFLNYKIPCCIFTYNNQPDNEFIKIANRKNIPLISVNVSTREIIQYLFEVLDKEFSSSIQLHGVMVEVFGMGALILGKSGVGKSECALELITKGHRLITDDVVHIEKSGSSTLIAYGYDLIKYHIEIRGIGIIDIQSLFGVGSVIDKKSIDIVFLLEDWQKNTVYERVGINQKFYDILGVKIPQLIIPVKPGRTLAVIIEAAVRNMRLRDMGTVSSLIVNNKLKKMMRLKK